MRLETLAIHAAHAPDAATGAVTAPIYLSTTFQREPDGGYPGGYVYSRDRNPNRDELERTLTAIEGGADAATFASGMAATMALFQSLAPGDHVIAPLDVYYGTVKLLNDVFARWGLEVTYVPMGDLERVRSVVQPTTRLIWVETPSNPALTITDITGVARIAHEAGALCACDNTWATPALTNPLELGADVVMHATTKYLGGHSDVLGGALVTREANDVWERVRTVQKTGGAVPSPFECWLVLRGIKTLALRMREHSANAQAVAEALAGHPAVERVHYPGLATHPGADIARRQMSRPGGMLSFQVKGGREAALAVTGRVEIFTRATSLGGPESLIEHRESVEGPGTRTPDNLLRCSIGLEHPDDLIQDLFSALEEAR